MCIYRFTNHGLWNTFYVIPLTSWDPSQIVGSSQDPITTVA